MVPSPGAHGLGGPATPYVGVWPHTASHAPNWFKARLLLAHSVNYCVEPALP